MSGLVMPALDQGTLGRRAGIAADLRQLVPGEGVISDADELKAYESDGLTAYRQPPMLAVLPEDTRQVAAVLSYCRENRIKVVPRGAGTSLSGGALPLGDGVLLGLGKFKRILEIDYDNRTATVQPGVTNLAISQAVESAGFYYAPDPSSQIACTIGGNVAENSGGVHCLKYGVTTNNVLGVELVLMDGEIVRLGGKHLDAPGYDLLGVVTGSEGLLGVITEVTVRILRKPQSARAMLMGFMSNEAAGECVAGIISNGIIPGGLEMMDKPAIHAVEDFVHAGYPLDVEALLICELDGPPAEVDELIGRVDAVAREKGAVYSRVSNSEEERLKFWAGRKAAFPAIGRLTPDYYCMDGTIPRKELSKVLARTRELAAKYGLGVANVFHAGDGNLHPLIMYDANKPGELERAEAFGADILRLCVEVGGVLTGEHGVGVEKRDLMGAMFNELDLGQQERLKCAFDPEQLLNPGKVFPTSIAAPSSDKCTCTAAACASRTFRASRPELGGPMSENVKPRDAEEVRALVEWAAAEGMPLELAGAGTKRGLGRPMQATHSVDLSALSGVTLYEPEELVLSARAGTRLAEIEVLLAEKRQALAFEPADLGPLYGAKAGEGTIGGVLAANLSGPRRIKAGAARDHFLGFSAVNGRGELFKAGGRARQERDGL